MEANNVLRRLQSEMEGELTEGILPYWMTHAVDHQNGGFLGRVTHDGQGVPEADKGAVLNARILWTFGAAHRSLGDAAYRRLADRAYAYLDVYFWDRLHGGLYWMLDSSGRPRDDRKHVYAQAFAIYGLSEYYRATGHEAAHDRAVALYRLIEGHCADPVHGGYFEAYSRDWQRLDDARLSAKDDDEAKSMNTHLHVLEAYTNLYRVWPDEALKERLRGLVEVFLEHIVWEDGHHQWLFFDEAWTPQSDVVSYGHDIEASWLLLEAADVLGDAALRTRVHEASLGLARATLEEGMDSDGGILNEGDPSGIIDGDKHWWPQVEAVVGFVAAYEESGEAAYLQAAGDTWTFTKEHMLDGEWGGWFNRVRHDGTPYAEEDKVDEWKCCYHNARACLEVMRRADELLQPSSDGRAAKVEPASPPSTDRR